jgi:HPt (histidine-containing phosphotransfer) domain-containing protein
MDSELVYSTLADDPDYAEMVELFVGEMPERIEKFLGQAQDRDWANLAKAAHQLKGAAGSYGFDVVTTAAARVESAVKEGCQEEAILAALEEVVSLGRRMRSGLPT